MVKNQRQNLYWALALGGLLVLVLIYQIYSPAATTTTVQVDQSQILEAFTEGGKKNLIPDFENLSIGAQTRLVWQIIRTIESHHYCSLRADQKCLKKHVDAVQRVFNSRDQELYYDLLRQRRNQDGPLSKWQTVYLIINRIGRYQSGNN